MDPTFVKVLRPYLRFIGAAELTSTSRLFDLGLDSMQAVELLFAIEDEYGIELGDEQLTDATFETAGSLWTTIDRAHRPAMDGAA
jgi:acyl carrier protein